MASEALSSGFGKSRKLRNSFTAGARAGTPHLTESESRRPSHCIPSHFDDLHDSSCTCPERLALASDGIDADRLCHTGFGCREAGFRGLAPRSPRIHCRVHFHFCCDFDCHFRHCARRAASLRICLEFLASAEAAQRDTEANQKRRAEFLEKIHLTPPDNLIFLDESGVTTSMTRL